MKSGSRYYLVKAAAACLIMMIAAGVWWWQQPKTDEELFQVRCSGCHELRAQRLCEFDEELRPHIVHVMRQQHGAEQAIDGDEAVRIERYLREEFRCQ